MPRVDEKLLYQIRFLSENLKLNIPYYKNNEIMMRIFQNGLYNKYVEYDNGNGNSLNNYFMIYMQ